MLDLAMKMFRGYVSALFCLILTCAGGIQASDLPRIQAENGAGQLVVYGKPFLNPWGRTRQLFGRDGGAG